VFICRNIGARELMALLVTAARAYRSKAVVSGPGVSRVGADAKGRFDHTSHRAERPIGGSHGRVSLH